MRLLFSLLLAPFVVAQGLSTASLTGRIVDSAQALVPNASITLRNPATSWERSQTSSAEGQYAFSAVPVGVYTLTVSASGFSRFEQSGVRLTVNTASTLNVQLTVGAISDSVTVQADTLMVNTVSGTLSQTVQQRYIEELPLNGRNAAQLVRMVPCVVTGTGTGNAGYANSSDTIAISANGSRGNEVNYRLDGATHMDNVTNLNAAYPNPDALQEFTVQTSNFSAQYGNFSGAVVNVVTRSGSNDLRGSLLYFARNGASGPGLSVMDASLAKSFRFHEKASVSLRLEAFNTLNQANYDPPLSNISDTNVVGSISQTVMPARQMQFAIRLDF